MPVDYLPAANGTVEVELGRDGVLRARVSGGQMSLGVGSGHLHTSHFATCPKADWHRRR